LHDSPPIALHGRAEEDLAFVRAAVERSSLFSAVPGVGGVMMGLTALAVGIALKARRRGVPLDIGPARRFVLGLAPPIVAGAALTFACVRENAWQLIPAVWLLCYGIAVLGAGAVSATRVVPALGAAFLVTGLASIASPASWGDAYMAFAFGGAHIVAGAIIARYHGG
jgi:hypothetical protein